jgi:rubredoxin
MSGYRCNDCGRFFRPSERATWAEIYDMVGYGLDHERHRCETCTLRYGPVRSNARPYNGDMRSYEGFFVR